MCQVLWEPRVWPGQAPGQERRPTSRCDAEKRAVCTGEPHGVVMYRARAGSENI